MSEFTLRIAVPRDHPCFAGHFPEHPIVPGVLLLDLIATEIQARLPQPVRLAAIPSAKFQRPVAPEEAVDVQVRISDAPPPHTVRARFLVTSDGKPVTEGHFLLAIIDSNAADESSRGHG